LRQRGQVASSCRLRSAKALKVRAVACSRFCAAWSRSSLAARRARVSTSSFLAVASRASSAPRDGSSSVAMSPRSTS